MNVIFAIFRKEMIDALRDRRTLMVVMFSSLLMVPLMLMIFSAVLSQVESQEDKRTVIAVGMQSAPSLENFILRQGYQIKQAPDDYEAKSRSKELELPVLIVPKDFEEKLSAMEHIVLQTAYDTSNQQQEFGLRPLNRLLSGFSQEVGLTGLAMRGISSEILQQIEVKERYVNRPDERKATLTSMLPMVILMAIVIGGMYAAIDTTAGERERGSLEPLMMNPISGWQLTLGKWSAVAAVCTGVVILTVLSFFPSQWMIHNDTVRAEFQFAVKDAIAFLFVLIPLAIAMPALQVAIALECKTHKEAQVRSQLLSFFVPLVTLFPIMYPGREPAWFQWVPVLAQNQMMNHVLKGEALDPQAILIALLVCIGIAVASLSYVAKRMRGIVTV